MDFGLFLHNAQGVRVLNEIENSGKGLNITVQVLDGILCHNGEILSLIMVKHRQNLLRNMNVHGLKKVLIKP